MNLEQKKVIVAELSDIAHKSVSVVVLDYRGLTVSEISELRRVARNTGVIMRVCRNNLTIRAFKDTSYACLNGVLTGPVMLFFSQKELGAAARLIEKFIKEHKQSTVKALALGGSLLLADRLKTVAQLPSREVALSQLAAVLSAPVIKFICVFNEPVFRVIRVVSAIQDKRKE